MNILKAPNFVKRFYSSVSCKKAYQHLKERCLVQVKGPDATDFLQGLMTNDIHHLSRGVGSMFTMFLSIKGRILYDALVYKTDNNDEYLLECDSKVKISLEKHLKMYKVKRKVDISCLENHSVYALYNLNVLENQYDKNLEKFSGEYLPENTTELKIYKDLFIFKDPRVAQLGFRVILEQTKNIDSLKDLIECERSDSYRKLRYSLGVGEGTDELGNCNPLESNCDYLHGVSFHKGCYIGQELTARTYHTGVIRKRLMPLLFSKIPTRLPDNNMILHDNVHIGKLKGVEENVGLALLRIKQALENQTIIIGDGEANVVKPNWWPIKLPKEKLNIS